MSLDRVVVLVLLTVSLASAPVLAQRPSVRLIVPTMRSLDTPPPKRLIDPDTLPQPNLIELVQPPAPLPALTPTITVPISRLHDELRIAFPSSKLRIGFVGEQIVLTGHAADARESRAILELVEASTAGHRVVSHLRVRGQVLLRVLAVEIDRSAAASVGLQTMNGVGEQTQVAASLAALFSRKQAKIVAAQSIPASEGKTAAFSAPRCQVTLCANASTDSVSLAVTARFSPADRIALAQALQTVVEVRPRETLILTSHCPESERDIVLFVTPEWVGETNPVSR